jgi:hypothetical protein
MNTLLMGARAGVITLGVAALLVLTVTAADAQARLQVSQTTGLSDGQSVTVSGSGFTPGLTQIAVGQCITPFTGPAHCHLAGGATFVNADDSGNLPSVTLKLDERFGDHDCTARQCVVAAQILPNAAEPDVVAANRAEVTISFGQPGSSDDGGGSSGGSTDSGTNAGNAATGGNLPNTGPAEEVALLGLWSTALLLLGMAALVGVPRVRRGTASQ